MGRFGLVSLAAESCGKIRQNRVCAVRKQAALGSVSSLPLECCRYDFTAKSPRAQRKLEGNLGLLCGLAVGKAPEALPADVFLADLIRGAFDRICSKMAFLDALILYTAEQYPEARAFITWNARHFRGKTSLSVLTPRECLEERHQDEGIAP
ncbi:MAG: hypothetical protein QHJ81_03615 [Anaerolineae bacterium]|nr:hypothetical protein [Anaerolineae bacterium]